MGNMTLRLDEGLDEQLKLVASSLKISKHQLIIDLIMSGLQSQTHINLEVANQVQEQLNSDRSITELTLDTQTALTNLQAQLQHLQQQYLSLKDTLTARKAEPEHIFYEGQEITKQSTKMFSLILNSTTHTQRWVDPSKRGDAKIYHYHDDFNIITLQGRTKSDRKKFTVVAIDVDDLAVSPDDEFISPLGNLGYDPDTWEQERTQLKTKTCKPYEYRIDSKTENWVMFTGSGERLTFDEMSNKYEIPKTVLATMNNIHLCLDGVWTSYLFSDDGYWRTNAIVEPIDWDLMNATKHLPDATPVHERRDYLRKKALQAQSAQYEPRHPATTY